METRVSIQTLKRKKDRKLKLLNFVSFTVRTEPPRAAPTPQSVCLYPRVLTTEYSMVQVLEYTT